MRYTELPLASTGLPNRISVLGYGSAPLMGRAGRKASLESLRAAFDAGINFFDTARSYGYGESETLLGEFLHGRRDSVVLCTKFGILPARRGGWKRKLKPMAQAAIGVFPQLRQFARRQAAGQFVAGQFTPDVLRASLETSLRELRTDYVDMLLMHDAKETVLENDALMEALERLVAAGTVRMAGLSGPHGSIRAAFAHRPTVITTAQFAMNPENFAFAKETARAQARTLFLVANHPFGGASGVATLKARIGTLQNDISLPAGLRDKLRGDASLLMPEVTLNCILQETGVSAVVAAMVSPQNLARNVAAVNHCRFSTDELKMLREKLSSVNIPQAAA